MKKKLFALLAMVMTVMTASAVSGYTLSVGTSEHGTLTFSVGGEVVETAAAGDTVVVTVAAEDGYVATALRGVASTSWGAAKARTRSAIGMVKDFELEGSGSTWKFEMPAADVEVSADYVISLEVEAEETQDETKEVEDVKLDMEVAEDVPVTTDDLGRTVITVDVESIEMPEETNTEEITVIVPAEKVVGNTVFKIRTIKADAFKAPEGSDVVVTKVVLPEAEEPLDIEEGAMKPEGEPIEVVTPLALLDDYALMTSLQENFEAVKISAVATAPNKYWSFSSGVDVVLPDGVKAYTCISPNGKDIQIIEIQEAELLIDGKRVVKANNGVLLGCINEKGGDDYKFVANPGNQLSGTKPAFGDAKSYGTNLLKPVIADKHYEAGEYLVLKDNEFHPIKDNASKVPACKAVLLKPSNMN